MLCLSACQIVRFGVMVVPDHASGAYSTTRLHRLIIRLSLDDENAHITPAGCVITAHSYRYTTIPWATSTTAAVVGHMDENSSVKVELVGVYFTVSGFLCFTVSHFASVDTDSYRARETGV